MSFIKQFIELQKQKKALRNDVNQKRAAITQTVYDGIEVEKTCIENIPVINVNGINGTMEIHVKYRDCFVDGECCKDQSCRMWQKNNAYNNANELYKTVKSAQWQLVKDALKIRKK